MKVNKITKPLICDTVLCNKLSSYQIDTESYKGSMFLCENCYKKLQTILKRNPTNHDSK